MMLAQRFALGPADRCYVTMPMFPFNAVLSAGASPWPHRAR